MQNIIVASTMNEDETTQLLQQKSEIIIPGAGATRFVKTLKYISVPSSSGSF
jgi:hypothetical protein